MKKYNAYKTVQLVLFIALTVVIILRIFPSAEIYHQAATDPAMKILCAVLWAVLGLSFLFILLDFTFFFGYMKEYREMEQAIHSDPVSGIANRLSCDMYIEKYLDKPVPENMGCIMFDLTNLKEINKEFGHLEGNATIRDFSNILRLSSEKSCFVGRNGGNKFLAIFENATELDMQSFLVRVAQRTAVYNRDTETGRIEYKYGTAMNEGNKVKGITDLIALSNSRIWKS